MTRKWPPIIAHAAEIVKTYDTSVTLRQLFYRLVADQTIPNSQTCYGQLGRRIAEARRHKDFPDLIDPTREISVHSSWPSPHHAIESLAKTYRRDRTEGQPCSIYLGVEKAGILEQLNRWFGPLGIPILSLRGYASQSFVFMVAAHVEKQRQLADSRPAVLLYAGDFDYAGVAIPAEFKKRTACFDKVTRVALTHSQIERYDLPVGRGKNHAAAQPFISKYGNIQVEVDALPPNILREKYQKGIDQYWDVEAYNAVLAKEQEDRRVLQRALH
jgi:hypothetical protein